jgi:AcrR family transcriptional regulator
MPHVPAVQRRQEFVDAAVRVIAEYGLADATTRRIAEAADAPLASLHYCFGSKDELFFAVFESQAELLGHRVGRSEPGVGLVPMATQALREIVGWFHEHRDRALASIELELWASRQDADGNVASRSYDVHIRPLTQNLRRACGEADNPALAEPAARLINVLVDGLLQQWCAYRDDGRLADDTERACVMLELFLERGDPGVRRRKGQKAAPRPRQLIN